LKTRSPRARADGETLLKIFGGKILAPNKVPGKVHWPAVKFLQAQGRRFKDSSPGIIRNASVIHRHLSPFCPTSPFPRGRQARTPRAVSANASAVRQRADRNGWRWRHRNQTRRPRSRACGRRRAPTALGRWGMVVCVLGSEMRDGGTGL